MSRARELADGRTTLVTDSIALGNNEKIKLGDTGELEIYHDGSNSFVAGKSGSDETVVIKPGGGGGVLITNSAGDNILSQQGDAAHLHYDGVTKLATASGGVTMTGAVTASGYFASESYRHTNGSNSLTISSDGHVTAVSGITSTASANAFGASTFSGTKTTALSSMAHFETLGLVVDDSANYNTAGVGGGIAFRGKRNSSGTQTVYGAIDAGKEDTANDSYKGSLRFYTNNNSTGVPTRHLQIDSAGLISAGPFGGGGNAIIAGSSSPSFTNQAGTNLLLKSGDGSGSGGSFMTFSTSEGGAGGTTVRTAQERMRINSSGNVGIGTSSPDRLLHLQKTRAIISGGTGDTGAVIKLHTTAQFEAGYNSSATDFLGGLEFSSNDTSGSGLAGAGVRAAIRASVEDAYNNVALSFETGGTRAERMRIDNSGRVGIGTSPSTRGQLHVHNATDNARAAIQLTSYETGAGVSNGFAIQVTPNAANGDKECSLTQFENAAMLFHTNNTEAMRIDSSGRVGIGTTSLGGGRGLTVANGAITSIGQNTSHSASSLVLSQNDSALSQIRFYGANTSTAGILQFTGSSSDGTVGGERMRIDSSGRVGIANDSPGDFNAGADDLVIGNSSQNSGITIRSGTSNSGNIFFADGTSGNQAYRGYVQYQNQEDRLVLGAAGDDQIFIYDNKIAIGNSDAWHRLQITGNGTLDTSIFLHNDTDGNGEYNGIIFKADSTNTNVRKKAGIFFERLGTRGTGRLHFCNEGNNSDANVDLSDSVLRINGGWAGVGTDTQFGSAYLAVYSNNNMGISLGYGTGTNEYRRMYHHVTGLYFQSSTNQAYLNAAGAWINASDVTLKKDIEDITYGIATIKNLKPRKYKMKSDDEEQIGFIAQEINEEVPEIVSGKDGILGVSYGQLTAVLTKALQEQQVIIESLTARITTLEG